MEGVPEEPETLSTDPGASRGQTDVSMDEAQELCVAGRSLQAAASDLMLRQWDDEEALDPFGPLAGEARHGAVVGRAHAGARVGAR